MKGISLEAYKFVIKIRLLEDALLPEYKGSMFRGAFGWAFRDAVCITKEKECGNCILKGECSYFRIFETEVKGEVPPFLKGVRKIPHPFILHPPITEERNFEAGTGLEIGLTIFGDYIKLFPFFAYTFRRMGEKGISFSRSKYELKEICAIDKEGNEEVILAEGSSDLKCKYFPVRVPGEDNKMEIKEIKLKFTTPFRVQENGKLIMNPAKLTPGLIIRGIIRRLAILSFLFGKYEEGSLPEFGDDLILSENNLYYHDWERYSSRQKRKVMLGGLKGEIILKGDIAKYYGLLSAGSKISIGKNTVFGLGRYEIE